VLYPIHQQLDGHRFVWTNAWHGSDAEGRVIRPAILWNDQRTGKAVDAIEATISRQELIQRTGKIVQDFKLQLVWLLN